MKTDAPTRQGVNGSRTGPPTEPEDYMALNAVFAALLAGVVIAARR